MDRRLSQLKIFDRDDVKYMCDWVITLPKIMGNDERRFFEETFKFLVGKYKKKNVISAYVHKDETTPHMHFAFVPVAVDKKKNIEKLCSKDIIGRDDLLAFHEELDNYLTSVFGYCTGVRNGATKEGNKSIDELKRGTAVKALNETLAKKEAAEKKIDALEWGNRITPVKEKRDTVVISKGDLETANDALSKRHMLEDRAREAEKERDQAVNRDYNKEISRLWHENLELKEAKKNLEGDVHFLSDKQRETQKVFDRYPKFWDEFVRLAAELERIEQAELRAAQAEKRALQNQAQMEIG
jgi:hypothetical protein